MCQKCATGTPPPIKNRPQAKVSATPSGVDAAADAGGGGGCTIL
jgi:hypothetical protein